MAADDPILLGLTGAVFLLTAETGGIIQSFSRKTTRKNIPVYDPTVGKTTGMVYHDPSASYDIKVITTGNNGVVVAAPGVAITLANVTTGNGVTSGGIYTSDTTLEHQGEQLQTFSFTATQHPGIA